ncbi:MAG: PAS domain S-box protein [Verrucomicrobiales bacterium]|nr:PAS domain S-box protein [Verrucomicrobiales bacterium]
MSSQHAMRLLAIVGWFLLGGYPGFGAANPSLRTVAQVRALSAEEAERAHDIQLEGLVTFVDEPNFYSFLQDDSGGVYFEYQDRKSLKAGERVRIDGFTAVGDFTPVVRVRQLTRLGTANWPSARRVGFAEFKSGAVDSTFVELLGSVHAASMQNGWLRMKVAQPEGHLVVWVRDPEGVDRGQIVGAEIRARGVCAGAFGWQTKIVDFELFVADATTIEVLSKPTPVDQIPLTPVSKVGLDWQRRDTTRIRCRGQVTVHWPGQALFVQDELAALELKLAQPVDLQPGDWVEALGFPVWSQSKWVLDDCQVTRLTLGPPLDPKARSLKDVHRRHRHGEYVTLTARIVGTMEEPFIVPGPLTEELSTRPTLILENDRWFLRAALPPDFPKTQIETLAPESVVEVSGVIVEHDSMSADPSACHLLVKSPGAIRVVTAAPWWTARRVTAAVALGGGLFIAVLGSVAGISHARRRRMEADLGRQNEEALRYQGVLLELAKSSNTTLGTADFERILEVVARALSLDRASLWRRLPDGESFVCANRYPSDTPIAPEADRRKSCSSNFLSSLDGQRICAIENVRIHDAALDFRDAYLVPNGVQALLVAPLLMRGAFVGALCLEETRKERPWTLAERAFATAAADQLVIFLESAERERAQRALLESEQKFARAFQNTPDALVVTTLDTEEYLEVNEAFCRISGLAKGEILGKSAAVLTWAKPEHRRSALHLLREGKPVRDMESTIDSRDGGRVEVLVSCDRIMLAGRACLIGILRDITARNRADRQLREAHAELEVRVVIRTTELSEARDRAESADRTKSAFLAAMSHELRTPLNSILGFTGILHQGMVGPINEEQKKQLGMVLNSGRHLLSLINDVLDISKIEANQVELLLEPFSLRDSIGRACQMLSPLAKKKGLRLAANLDHGVGTIVSDKRRVEQILINIINNAVKFTEVGTISVDCVIADDFAKITVTDTGIGIREEDLQKLFRPFQQLDVGLARLHEGTGLGLAICHRLARLLGGRITVQSDYGKGSAFSVEIPCEPPR